MMPCLTVVLVVTAAAASGADLNWPIQVECESAGKIIDKQKPKLLSSLTAKPVSVGDVDEVTRYVHNIIDMIDGRTICEKVISCENLSRIIHSTYEELVIVFKAAVRKGDAIFGCDACALKRLPEDFLESLLDDAVMVVISGIAREAGLTVQYVRPPCTPGTEPCDTRWSSILLNPK